MIQLKTITFLFILLNKTYKEYIRLKFNKQIKGQILNWHQLYYYQNGSQNQIISNNDYSNNNYN